MDTLFQFVPYSLELKEPFGTAHGTRTHTDGMIVSLKRGDVTGYGEVFMPPYYPENQETIASFFEKINAAGLLAFDDLNESIDYLFAVETGNSGAKTALDIALHDLFCKENSIPVREYISTHEAPETEGDFRPQYSVPSTQYSPATSFTIGIDTIETMVRKAREASEFPILKIKLNGRNDVEVITAIRSVTDQALYVDANQGWDDVETAVRTSGQLVDLGVGLIEQPFKKGQAEKAGLLRDRCEVPIVADEEVQTIEDIERLAEFYDGINIKLMKAGGVREAQRMIRKGRECGLKILLGCMTESSIGISAAAQLAHLADWCDLDGNLLIKNDTCTGVETVKGELRLGDAAGIGITDDSKLKGIFKRDI